MTMGCCSRFSDAAGRQFDDKKAAAEMVAYRKHGPGTTTRLLRDGLATAGLASGVLLDIGAGSGALTFELIERGATRAIAVDASRSYLAVATEEPTRRGKTGVIEFIHGDFVEIA